MKKILEGILTHPKYRQMRGESACSEAGDCGGCVFSHISYAEELELKQMMIDRAFHEHEDLMLEFEGIHGAALTEGYRNKMELSFGDAFNGGPLNLGMRRKRSFYEAGDASNCLIAHPDFRIITETTLNHFREAGDNFFHRRKLTGTLRNLVLRRGHFTGETQINLVTADGTDAQSLDKWAKSLLELPLEGNITGILHTVCRSASDAVKADEIHTLYGRDYFFEELLGLRFRISPFSFFQTNSPGAASLYQTAVEFAGDISDKTVFDLYCGTGTIAQVFAQKAKKVIGVELNPDAVEAAKANARENGLSNCEFIAGDVGAVVGSLTDSPDIIVLDPPREGVLPKALDLILDFKPKRLVYISCNAQNLARDLHAIFERGYISSRFCAHDMFPRTGHLEAVISLRLKI